MPTSNDLDGPRWACCKTFITDVDEYAKPVYYGTSEGEGCTLEDLAHFTCMKFSLIAWDRIKPSKIMSELRWWLS